MLAAAAGLIRLGVNPGDRVAIMASNRTEHVIADLGAVHAGAVPMSVYSTFSTRQVNFIAGHAEPIVVVLEGAVELAAWRSTLSSKTVLDPGSDLCSTRRRSPTSRTILAGPT